MARRSNPPPPKQPANLTPEQMQRGIELLNRRLAELRAFDPNTVKDQFHHPELSALSTRIDEALVRAFGFDTLDHSRYSSAAHFSTGPISLGMGSGVPLSTVREEIQESKERNIATLETAIHSLQERLADEGSLPVVAQSPPKTEYSRSIFIVHGHDDVPKLAVARFVERLGFTPIILHEQPNQGRTVIEKFEAYSEVGFAVVILTPDDQCISKTGQTTYRARQNVILELGFFAGKLSRSRVMALKKGDVELPSDYVGVVYTEFDDHDGWKSKLAKELQAANYEVDWNKVMR